MADALKTATKPFDVEALKAALAKINSHKEEASEAQGRAGQATKQACDDHNFNRKALTLISQLAKKEPQQQQEVLAAIVTYAEALGMFDQIDMFNDAVTAMGRVVERATAGQPGTAAPGAGNVARLARSEAVTPH